MHKWVHYFVVGFRNDDGAVTGTYIFLSVN